MQKSPTRPYIVHATYAEGMLKRHRLREAQLWLSDAADYYTPAGLLVLDLGQLDAPADWERLPSKDRVQFHMKNMAMQLTQVWSTQPVMKSLATTNCKEETMCRLCVCMLMRAVVTNSSSQVLQDTVGLRLIVELLRSSGTQLELQWLSIVC